jgi:hypothetical protein
MHWSNVPEGAASIMATPTNAAAMKAADHFPWDLLIPLLPQLLGLVLLAAILLLLGRKRILTALRRIKKVGFAGVEIELAEELDAAAANKKTSLTSRQASRTVRLLEENAAILSCARLLWVDDNLENNLREMKILRRLCVQIDIAQSTEDARQALRRGIYDIVISDMGRGADPRAGDQMGGALREAPLPGTLIYYVGEEQSPPLGAFGLTTRPDELFQLIVEALKRRRPHPDA